MNRLNEIEARANAATEGPWEAKSETPTMAGAVWNLRITGKPGIRMNVTEWQHGMENAEFIAHARTDVPWLLEQVELRDKALEAALNEHPIGVFHSFAGDIQWCDACDGPYPCPTVTAIRQHLGDDL